MALSSSEPGPSEDLTPGERIELPPPPPELIDALQAGNVVAFVGAGVAAEAGYPSWQATVTDLLDWAQRSGQLDTELSSPLRASLEAGDYDNVADHLSGVVSKPRLADHLGEIFGRSSRLPPSYRTLADLPLAGAMTSNYDNLLNRAFPGRPQFTPQEIEGILDCLSQRRRFILAAYGVIDNPRSLILGPAEFEQLLRGNLEVAQVFEAIFSTRTLLFLGMTIKGISDFLRAVPLSSSSRTGPSHYAIIDITDSAWQLQASQLRRRYNVAVLPYSGSDHGVPERFLAELASVIAPLAQATHPGRETLDRITIENIGPFEHLELELSSHWNVLLGDNGVGKSTVLKAIALVYAGNDATGFGDRLLRAGASRGSIRLDTSTRRSFVTELVRGTSGVQVRHISGVKLEAENQLVVALPPLRSVSWRREAAPNGGQTVSRPTSADVLPLLVGDPDPRLDTVKQRIINADYLAKHAISGGGDPSGPERLLADMVKIIATLTGDLNISFKRVDPPNAVIVDTIDGELPIEALSQGTGSFIGWAGILVQRLHDTAALRDEKPLERPAIVLVDELDAHMHPGWQQQMTSRLGDLFPNVQFIATTHSPLVVSGLAIEEIQCLTRYSDGAIRAAPLDDYIPAARADQILTSPAFGLETTLPEQVRENLARYGELHAQQRRSTKEQEEYTRLQQEIGLKIPLPYETAPERRAEELVRALIRAYIADRYEDERDELLSMSRDLFNRVADRDQN